MSSVKVQVLVPMTPFSSAPLFCPLPTTCPLSLHPSDHFIHRILCAAVFLWGSAPSASPQMEQQGLYLDFPWRNKLLRAFLDLLTAVLLVYNFLKWSTLNVHNIFYNNGYTLIFWEIYILSLCAGPFISVHGSTVHGCHLDPVQHLLLLLFIISEQGNYMKSLKCFLFCVGHWPSTYQGSLLERLEKPVCPLTVPSGLS